MMATEYLVESRWKVGYNTDEGFYYLEDTQALQPHTGPSYSYFTSEEVNHIAKLYMAVVPIKNEVISRVVDLGVDDGWYLNLWRNFDGDLQARLAYNGPFTDLVGFNFNSFSDFSKVVWALSELFTVWNSDD